MRIGIDIDDVMCDFVGKFIRYYNKATGDDVKYDTVSTFHLTDHLREVDNYEQLKTMIHKFCDEGHYASLIPEDGAIYSVKKLIKDGHDVFFITSRTSRAIHDTYLWFDSYGLPLERIYFEKEKGWLANKLDLDIHIDDSIFNLENVEAAGVEPIRFERPWNRQTGITYERVQNWDDILDYVRNNDTK